MLRVVAGENGLELTAEMLPGVPECVSVDSGRLRQILMNLLGNAIKSTEQGNVSLRVQKVILKTGF